jgi:hypothetical protein
MGRSLSKFTHNSNSSTHASTPLLASDPDMVLARQRTLQGCLALLFLGVLNSVDASSCYRSFSRNDYPSCIQLTPAYVVHWVVNAKADPPSITYALDGDGFLSWFGVGVSEAGWRGSDISIAVRSGTGAGVRVCASVCVCVCVCGVCECVVFLRPCLCMCMCTRFACACHVRPSAGVCVCVCARALCVCMRRCTRLCVRVRASMSSPPLPTLCRRLGDGRLLHPGPDQP